MWGKLPVNSNNNHIVNSLFGGNGSVCAAALCAAVPAVASNNDFGVGLIGREWREPDRGQQHQRKLERHPDSDRCVRQHDPPEHRSRTPPARYSRTYGPIGFDIKDEAPTNGARNTFDRNWCISICRTGTFPLSEFSRSGASEDLGADGDTRRPLASERAMVSVTIGVTVTDDSDPSPACQISSVTSNEPSAASDWSVTGPLSLSLRGSEWSWPGTNLFDYGEVHQRVAAERQRGGFGPRAS